MIKFSAFGRLTSEPTTRELAGGRAVCSFGLASDTGVKDASGNKITNFFNCNVWNRTGEIIQKNFHKGDPIIVYGKFCARPYQGTDGTSKTSMDVSVDDFEFIPNGKKAGEAESSEQSAQPRRRRPAVQTEPEDDELPF